MKKIVFYIPSLIFLISSNIYAQKAYISLHTGYSLKSSSQSTYNTTAKSNNSTSIEHVNLSLGKGVNIGGTFGYMFYNNMGAELGLSYLIGSKTKATSINAYDTTSNYYTKGDIDISSKMLLINPSFIIKSKFLNIKPYAKFGAIIGIGQFTTSESKYYNEVYNSSTKYLTTTKFNGGFAFGLTASLGASYSIKESLSAFGELTYTNLAYAPTKSEITTYSRNDIDKLNTLNISQKNTEYVNKITNTNTSGTTPTQKLKESYTYGSIGLNIGLRYYIW